MASHPHFYLKSPKAEKSSIYMGLKLNDGKVFKYYIKEKVFPELFDKKSQRAITTGELLKEYSKIDGTTKIHNKNINTLISNLENDTNNVLSQIYRNEKVVTKELLKEKLDAIYNPTIKKEFDQSFINYLDDFIAKIESGDKLHNGKRYKHGTIKTYYTFRSVISDYNKRLTFDVIDMTFYDSFIKFLHKRNYTYNSIGKNIKFVKVILRDSYESGYHNNLIYTHKDFRTLSTKSEAVYLTEDELNKIYELDLSNKPNYELARDVFLCGCYTAQRYSDYSRIKSEHIKKVSKNKYRLEMITKKTESLVKVPLKPIILEILAKYDNNLPKTYETKVNKYIKEICKKAEINQSVEISTFVNGKKLSEFKPKYELVKTHTARRTGATLMYLNGIQPVDLMKITTHTKIATLLKYIKVSKEETAERISDNPFFQ